MHKFLNSLLKAIVITTIIHIAIILLQIALNAFDIDDVMDILGITFPGLMIPIFLSFFTYKIENHILKEIIKVFVINFSFVFIVVYFFFRFYINPFHGIFDFQNFTIATISSFVTVFFTLYQKISFVEITNDKYLNQTLKFSYSRLALIPLSGSIFYIIIMSIDRVYLDNVFQVLYKFLPIGFIFSLISIHFLNYTFKEFNKSRRRFYIALYYVGSIFTMVFWIMVSVNNFRIIKDGLGAALDRAFIIPSIALYAPFFIYVLIVTHWYFVSLVNSYEKKILVQNSLESQLNYQQLKNQLSPHFLFNNINVLTSLIEENPKRAVQYSSDLASIYHYFLEHEQKDVVKISDELSFAKKYLNLLKNRFENALSYTVDVNKEVNHNYILSTILQQVLENVIKHNIVDANNPIEVAITSNHTYLIISNNKNSKPNVVKYTKKGIENIKSRMAFFTDNEVIIEDSKDRFTIKLPILEAV